MTRESEAFHDEKGVRMAKIESPRELFVQELGAALTMEETTLGMLEELQQKANDPQLKQNLRHHHQETEQQVRNLERAFEALGREADSKPCPTIDGLKKEGEQMLKNVDEQLNDAVILSGVVETEAHETAVYDGLITTAEAMGEDDIVALLQENLEQEQATLKKGRDAKKRLAQREAQRV
jgi:ferritin-like metal-binding protein YciE